MGTERQRLNAPCGVSDPQKALFELGVFALTTSVSPDVELRSNIQEASPNRARQTHHMLTHTSAAASCTILCRRSFKVVRFVSVFHTSDDESQTLPLGCQGGFWGCGKHPRRHPVAILSAILESEAGQPDPESVLRAELQPPRPVGPQPVATAPRPRRIPRLPPDYGSRCWHEERLLAWQTGSRTTSTLPVLGQRTYKKKTVASWPSCCVLLMPLIPAHGLGLMWQVRLSLPV